LTDWGIDQEVLLPMPARTGKTDKPLVGVSDSFVQIADFRLQNAECRMKNAE
jgi:hypothetical protein